MPISVVQSKHNQQPTGLSVSVTLSANPTPGNLLACSLTVGGTIAAPSYPWGQTPDLSNIGGQLAFMWFKVATPGESPTISFSNSSSRRISIAVTEVAPAAGRTWVGGGIDKSASATSSGSTVTSLPLGPTGLLTDPDEIALAVMSLSSTPGGAGGVWTDAFTVVPGADGTTGGFAGYKVLTTTAAVSATGSWTTSRAAVALLAAYRQAPLVTDDDGAFLSLL